MKLLWNTLALFLVIAGVGLFPLTNTGILSFAKPLSGQKISGLKIR